MSRPTLSIVIPAFNEGKRLGPTIRAVQQHCPKSVHLAEIVVVDDGSTDGTLGIPEVGREELAPIVTLRDETNWGKGHAVRSGMLAARGELLLLCDADLATPIEELDKLLPWIADGFDVAIASRDLPDSRLDPPQPRLRRAAAGAFRALRRKLLLPNIRDTQCGFKLFTRRAARDIFARTTVDGWLFDCEALGIAERLGYRIREVGVLWRNDPATHVRMFATAITTLPVLLSIRRKLRSI